MVLENGALAELQQPRAKKRKRRKSHGDENKSTESSKTMDCVPSSPAKKPEQSGTAPLEKGSPTDKVAILEGKLKRDGVRSANCLLQLIAEIKPCAPNATRAIHASRRALAQLSKAASVDSALLEWVTERRMDFSGALETLIMSSETPVDASESAVAVAAVAGGDIWAGAVSSALRSSGLHVIDIVGECFVARYADLRLIALQTISDGAGPPARRLALLGYCLSPPVGASMKSGVEHPYKRISRRAYSVAWTCLLCDTNISSSDLCAALAALPTAIPGLAHPLDVADFLKSCYSDAGNTQVAIAALDPLFVLVSKHGLDYPLFYHKLYALLTPEILFHTDGNARFLEMTAMFLRFGEFIPGGIIAAFIKRLARRALVAPPAGAMWCLRLALDLLHKHPNVCFLVHRAISLFDTPMKVKAKTERKPLQYKGADPFDDSEIDPQASGAEESSLWELDALRNHISPAVARLVVAFSKDVRKKPLPPPGDVADYAGLKFSDVFEAEFKRKAKNTPIAYDAPGEAPGVKEVVEDIEGSIVWR